MPFAVKPSHLVLAGLCALLPASCTRQDGGTPSGRGNAARDSEPRVTRDELTTYLDWMVEVRNETSAAFREAQQDVAQNADTTTMVEKAQRNRERQMPLLAREPFKGTVKGDAIRNVLQGCYASGTFFRDEKALENLRARYGKALVESILEHEVLIREKLDPK